MVARLSKHAPNQSIHYFGGRLDKFTPRLWHGRFIVTCGLSQLGSEKLTLEKGNEQCMKHFTFCKVRGW